MIERHSATISRRVISAEALKRIANEDPCLHKLIDRVEQPRMPIAGCALDHPHIVGILNVTPDSFSDGGRFADTRAAVEHGLQMEAEGADIIDVGGESTRPGSDAVHVDEESQRVLPVLAELANRLGKARLSIDTRKASVMQRATDAGARLVNDVSALTYDPSSPELVAQSGLPVVLMHAQGDPRTMQLNPRYDDVALDVYDALQNRVEACEAAGIPRSRIVVDPGIGFGKTVAHNLALLGSLSLLHGLGCAIMLGASRKSFIGRVGGESSNGRIAGSVAAVLAGAAQGVQFFRVHDVAETRQALAVWESAMEKAPTG